MILWHGQLYFGKVFVKNMNLLSMLMAARKFSVCFRPVDFHVYLFIRMRQYKLVEGPFSPDTVFTGEIGRLKSYEKQKPYVYFYFLIKMQITLFRS
jgi:hypothetical protein